MKNLGNRTLLDHWLAIRRGRRTPDRADLDPVAIRTMLPFTFMLDVGEDARRRQAYPVCVSGMRLDALFGRGVRGSDFLALWGAPCAAEVGSLIGAVVDAGQPAAFGSMAAPANRTPSAAEGLLLPLRCQGRTHARLLCSLIPLSAPAWFGTTAVDRLTLTSWRLLDPAQADGSAPDGDALPSRVEQPPRRFLVIQGGRSADRPGLATVPQRDVKLAVARIGPAPMPTRSS